MERVSEKSTHTKIPATRANESDPFGDPMGRCGAEGVGRLGTLSVCFLFRAVTIKLQKPLRDFFLHSPSPCDREQETRGPQRQSTVIWKMPHLKKQTNLKTYIFFFSSVAKEIEKVNRVMWGREQWDLNEKNAIEKARRCEPFQQCKQENKHWPGGWVQFQI